MAGSSNFGTTCVSVLIPTLTDLMTNAQNLRNSYLNGYVNDAMANVVLNSIKSDYDNLTNDFMACPCKFLLKELKFFMKLKFIFQKAPWA